MDLLVRPDRAEASLWRRFKSSGHPRLRESLFERYRRFARSLARRHARRSALGNDVVADLEQCAYGGLLEAIDRYDPARGTSFLSFATARIAGSIVDGLGNLDEHNAQYRFRRRAERERLDSLIGDEARTGQGNAIGQLTDLIAELALGLILAAEENEASGPYSGRPDSGFDTLAWRQTKILLHQRVDSLSEFERIVVRQHYQNDLLFSQIATMLGLSRGRISQIHKSALGKLRKTMRFIQ
ncbi:sigma-70 family RNA polymerase sigma factor [Sphingomonas colocasiae]|uniref:Sigma-70 family RNA polymerase sigma factor n=1 Tax=Sphingomonas colocasiae TaxID=1848973 RepID=A0ABS7PWC0_9SPHN|nr:sigma-70 family RNA polymerase sigma factor [Sphingomonas colocasiae]MBY8825568.1 sigma-70 family RNA polymerase sigma factor [Sphingomonas colocasiae]